MAAVSISHAEQCVGRTATAVAAGEAVVGLQHLQHFNIFKLVTLGRQHRSPEIGRNLMRAGKKFS